MSTDITIPAVTYVDVPNYKTLHDNAKIIQRASDGYDTTIYEAVTSGEGLQYDQSIGCAALMREREAAMTVNSYKKGTFISNDPNDSVLEHKLRYSLKWELPKNLYTAIISDARTLPYIEYLETLISNYYSRIVINNIKNIYNNAPAFYNDTIMSTSYNFKMYQQFIYLLTYIEIVLEHRHEAVFMEKSEFMRDVVEWCLTRKIPDINYLLRGPEANEKYSLDYIGVYSAIISPSTDKASTTAYLQLSTTQELNANLLKYRDEFKARKNVYDKNANVAQSYTISIDTRTNSYFKVDDSGNLVVDCSGIDLGSSISDSVDLNIDKAEVNTEILKQEPKTSAQKFSNLLNEYTIFKIASLLVLKTTYKTQLRIYDKCYITFPKISLDGRFNQVYKTGSLQISGKFIENENTKYWEFVPDNTNGIVYKPTTANVKQFEFYISPEPGNLTRLNATNFKIDAKLSEYFNVPIIVQNNESLKAVPLESDPSLLPETYIIRPYRINKKGIPEVLNYTFLWNRTLKTIQALPGNIDLNNVPKFNALRKAKTIKIDVGMMKPEYPGGTDAILEAMSYAIIDGLTVFELPKIVPITIPKIVTQKMFDASLKGKNEIEFDTSIRVDRVYVEPSRFKNNEYIESMIPKLIPEGSASYNKSYQDKFDEVIAKFNDCILKKINYIDVIIKGEPLKIPFKISDDPINICNKINSDKYDFKDILNLELSPAQRLFNNEYINNLINNAISQNKSYICVNGKNVEYFEILDLEISAKHPLDEFSPVDISAAITALKNGYTSFESEILGSTFYINRISNSDIYNICVSNGKISEKYVESVIYNDIDLSTMSINILDKEYFALKVITKNYEPSSFKSNNLDYALNNFKDNFVEGNTQYYIDYHTELIKKLIYADISLDDPTGYINLFGKYYKYIEYNSEGVHKQEVYKALKAGYNYYMLNGSKIHITLLSKNIAISSAKVYTYKYLSNQEIIDLGLTLDEIKLRQTTKSGEVYLIYDHVSDITKDLNNMRNVIVSDDEIINDIKESAAAKSDKLLKYGVEYYNVGLFNEGDINWSSLQNLENDESASLKSVLEIKYLIAYKNGIIFKYASDLSKRLTDEYETKLKVYEQYISENKTNYVSVANDLPEFTEEDKKDIDIVYQKWANYYNFYGLFIPDYNYHIKYEKPTSKNVKIYNDNGNMIDEEYNLFDWLINLYDIDENGNITRVNKRIKLIKIDDKYFEYNDIFEGIEPDENGNIHIPLNEDEEDDNENDEDDEDDDSTDSNISYEIKYGKYNSNIKDTEIYLQYYAFTKGDKTVNLKPINMNGMIISGETYIGISPTIKDTTINNYETQSVIDDDENVYKQNGDKSEKNLYNTLKDNDKDNNYITIQAFVEKFAQSNIHGTYKSDTSDEFDNNSFTEYFTESQTDSNNKITVKYASEYSTTDYDGNLTTFTDINTIDYNNLSIIYDLNNADNVKYVYRNFDIKANRYKTFMMDTDLFDDNIKFSTVDWLYSLAQLTYQSGNLSPYVKTTDLNLKLLTPGNNVTDLSKYMMPVVLKYYISWINGYSNKLIINSKKYGFSGISAFIDDKEYMLQTINDNLFSLTYDKPIEDALNIYSSGSRFKMIIELQ